MKTKLMLAALLASAAMAQAGPPISPAKIKAPLHISQIKSIFHQAAPSAPVQPTVAAGTAGATASTAGATGTAAPVVEPTISKRAKARTFLNHPVTAPGPH